MIRDLLSDLDGLADSRFEVIITVNVPEQEYDWSSHRFPVLVIRNPVPKGFGANHNAAFRHARGKYFAVVNPDIRAPDLGLDSLTQLFSDESIGAVAPLVRSSDGTLQDSARKFPDAIRLLRKLLMKQHGIDYSIGAEPISVDWVAGMFMVFRRAAYVDVRGFDERFFMYYEDVDICRRLRNRTWSVVLQPATSVIHDAQRASHRNWKHLRWHVTSAARYLLLPP